MTEAKGTTLVTIDASLPERIAGAIGDDDLLNPIAVCEDLATLAEHLESEPPSLVMVDISPDPAGTLAALPSLVDTHPHCRFVVIAAEFEKDQLFHAMQAGARHFLPKQWITPDIVPVCRELIAQALSVPSVGGSVYTVLASSGGCGATLLAINLAEELGIAASKRSLLVDLDVRFGGAATHLDLKGEYGIADVLERGTSLDGDLAHSTAVKYGDHLAVLLSPATIEFDDPALLNMQHMEQAVRAFGDGFRHTVIDATMLTGESAVALAEISTATILVAELTIKDLRNARAILAGLAKAGVETPVYVVINKQRRGQPISIADAKATLELNDDPIVLPEDNAAAVAAMNEGKSLAAAASKSKLRKGITQFASHLSANADDAKPVEASDTGSAKRRGLLGRKKAA